MKFILSAAAGALGVFVTFAFIPEITTLDLKDGDMRWEAIKRGDHNHNNLGQHLSFHHTASNLEPLHVHP